MTTSSIYRLFIGFFVSVLPHCAFTEVVSCRLGQSCVLPCRYEGQLNMIRWSRKPEDYNVLTFVNNMTLSDQHPLYSTRTSLSEHRSRGDASLRLSQVTLKDQGKFRCFTSSSRGDQSLSLKLTVFAPVLQVSLEQDGQQLVCRSEGIYPRPEVVWTPSTEHITTVSESEQGLFSVISSVSLSDSENKYICHISTALSWRRAVLIVKELEHELRELSSDQEGLYSCLHHTDTESVILRFQVKRTNYAVEVIIYLLLPLVAFGLIGISFFLIKRDNMIEVRNLQKQLKDISRKYQKAKQKKSTPEGQDPPPEGEDTVDSSVHPGDEGPAVVRFSAASGQVHVEVHPHDPLEHEEEEEKEEEEKLMSNHQDGE